MINRFLIRFWKELSIRVEQMFVTLLMMGNYNVSMQCTQDQISLAKARLNFHTIALDLRLFAFTVAQQITFKPIYQSTIHFAKFARMNGSQRSREEPVSLPQRASNPNQMCLFNTCLLWLKNCPLPLTTKVFLLKFVIVQINLVMRIKDGLSMKIG